MYKIGATVVLYNPSGDEISNIKSYIELVDFVVVIDNSDQSNEAAVHNAVDNAKNITYYSEQKNLGLCKGLNIGVHILKEKGCDWAILFDADSKMQNDLVDVYKKAIDLHHDKKVALFSPVHIYDRSSKKPYIGYKTVDWSMTSGWIVNIDIFERQGGFFEDLFVDGLDMDYCYKSHQNGYDVIECGEAVIFHHPAETRSFLGFKYGIASPFRYYMQARALTWCWRRYNQLDMIFLYLYKWFKVILFFPNKFDYVKQIIKGTKDGNILIRSYHLNVK